MNIKTKHLINFIIGNLLTKGLAFLSIPILTRVLTPEDYGIISIYESLILILISILGLGLSSGISRYYYETERNMITFLKSNIIFLFVYILLLSLLLFNLSDFIAGKLDLNPKIVRLAIIAGALGVIFDIYQRLLIASKKSKEYNILGVIKSIVVLSLTIILAIFLREKFYSKIYSIIIFGIIFFFFLLIKYRFYLKGFNIELKYIKYALVYSIPMIPAVLSNFILAQFDRIAITNITKDLVKTGLYSFAYNIGMFQQVIVLSIINTLRPYFYEYLNTESYDKINEMARKYARVIYCSAIILILFSKEIVIVMAKSDYYDALNLVSVIVMGYVFVFFYTLYFQYASYSKRTFTISLNTFLAGILNIYLNYQYIPLYGYKAAAFTTVASYFVLFILHYCNSKYYLKAKVIPLRIFFKDFLIFVILIIVSCYFLLNKKNSFSIIIIKLTLSIITVYIYLPRRSKKWIKNGLLKKSVTK